MMPGEIELDFRRDSIENGIPIDERTLTQIREAAESVGVLISERFFGRSIEWPARIPSSDGLP